ncbi:TatD family hydrolase [Gammaproteobacteria bacterium]|nr:TatD family hydrolase [Gammaproteobacteria bacterium]
MIDSHCHIQYLDQTYKETLKQAQQAGLTRLLNVAVVEDEWQKNLVLGDHPMVDVGLGIHPCDVQKAQSGWQERLLVAAQQESVVAIGETGLDYYRDTTYRKEQIQAFEDHIYIAKTLNKPIIVHMRSATEDTITVLEKHAGTIKGVIHCFSEDLPCALKMIDLGMMISFSGIVTFKNAVDIQQAAAKIPLSSLLVETDAPYLAPVPYRGKINYPHYVQYVIAHIANMRQISAAELTKLTIDNYTSWVL